jgi:hypothetical protein
LIKNAIKKDTDNLRKKFTEGKFNLTRDLLLNHEKNQLLELKQNLRNVNIKLQIKDNLKNTNS